MKVVTKEVVGVTAQGKDIVRAFIQADTEPETLPTSGADVDGMTENEVFANFSILYVTGAGAEHTLYIADESGDFVGQ